MVGLDAPREEIINNGKTPRTISVEKSVKKLTRPSAVTLRIPLPPFPLIGVTGFLFGSSMEKSKSELPYTKAKD